MFLFHPGSTRHSGVSASIWPLRCFLFQPGNTQEILQAYDHFHVFYFGRAALTSFCKHMATFMFFISAWQHSRDSASIRPLACISFQPGSAQEILQAYANFHAFLFQPGSTKEIPQAYDNFHVFYFSLAALKRCCKHMTTFMLDNFRSPPLLPPATTNETTATATTIIISTFCLT